jgi:hypothetical protein
MNHKSTRYQSPLFRCLFIAALIRWHTRRLTPDAT